MQNGLRDEDFVRTITKNQSQTFLEMLVESQKHILEEEVIQSKRNLNRSENNAKTQIETNKKNGP